MLLASRCPLCRRVGPAPCAACITELERAPALPLPPGLDAAHALLRYDGAGRELIARLKYRNARASVEWLATGMAVLVTDTPQVVTWIPTSAARRRARGFDQARLLAVAVARHLHRPCVQLLARAGEGSDAAQTGRSRAERLIGPTFGVQKQRRLAAAPPSTVLLVDDVVTTGGTATAAARALRRAGFESVVLVAAARTPPRRGRMSA